MTTEGPDAAHARPGGASDELVAGAGRLPEALERVERAARQPRPAR